MSNCVGLPRLSLPQREQALKKVVEPKKNIFSPPPKEIDLVFKSIYSAFTGSYAMYIWACAFGCQDLMDGREIHDFDVLVLDESAEQSMRMRLWEPLRKIYADREKPKIDIIFEEKRGENRGFGSLKNSEYIELNYNKTTYKCRVLKPEELINCLKRRDPMGVRRNTELDISLLNFIIKLKAGLDLDKIEKYIDPSVKQNDGRMQVE